jgi:hypothetical protein
MKFFKEFWKDEHGGFGGFGGFGGILKKAGGAAGSILSAPFGLLAPDINVPAPPPLPDPVEMADPDDELKKRQRLASVTKNMQGGRLSTIFGGQTGVRLGG